MRRGAVGVNFVPHRVLTRLFGNVSDGAARICAAFKKTWERARERTATPRGASSKQRWGAHSGDGDPNDGGRW